MPVDLIQSNTV